MAPSRRVRRPAAVLALAFLAGIAIAGRTPGRPEGWLFLGLLGAALLLSPLAAGRVWRSLALLALCVIGGGSVGARAFRSQDSGVDWVPRDGRFVALEIEGRVLGAAETAVDGERRLSHPEPCREVVFTEMAPEVHFEVAPEDVPAAAP